MHLKGRPVPGVIVQGALWTQYFLLLSDAMHVHSMVAHSSGAGSKGLSQTAINADISAVAERARDFVGRVCIDRAWLGCECCWLYRSLIKHVCCVCLCTSSTQRIVPREPAVGDDLYC
jgi:hypothetical protein